MGIHEPLGAAAAGGPKLSPETRMLPLPWQRVDPLDWAKIKPLLARKIKTNPLERESLRIIALLRLVVVK